jgi:hypothetical protein
VKFFVYNNKIIAVATSPTIFPVTIEKMYEPGDTIPPQSALKIGNPQFTANNQLFVSGATSFTVSATDADSGVQNIWYRFFPQGGSAPAYTAVVGSGATFTLGGSDGMYEVDSYATDNAGNDEGSHSVLATLDATPTVATIVQPMAAQYGHSDPLPLSYSVSDGSVRVLTASPLRWTVQLRSSSGRASTPGRPCLCTPCRWGRTHFR